PAVRVWVEAYLPVAAYTRHPGAPGIDPPDPAEVAKLFGPDLWKQALSAPLVAALAERRARPDDVMPVVSRLARVTDRASYSRPYPLEPHIAPGWLRLFGGLLEPDRPYAGPSVADALRVAARGLASLAFDEREQILHALAGELRSAVPGPDRHRLADWVDRLREM